MILSAYNLVKSKYSIPIAPAYPHHNIDGYRKSIYQACVKEFQKEYETTLNSRFREITDIQRSCVSFYALARRLGVYKSIKYNWINKYILRENPDSDYISVRAQKMDKILKSKAKLMCLNDTQKSTYKDREKIKIVLQQKFPYKSSFEI